MVIALSIFLGALIFFSLVFYKEIAGILYGGFRCIRAQYRRSFNKERDYEAQVAIHNTCSPCEFRDGNLCGVCGCILAEKIPIKKEKCPEGKW